MMPVICSCIAASAGRLPSRRSAPSAKHEMIPQTSFADIRGFGHGRAARVDAGVRAHSAEQIRHHALQATHARGRRVRRALPASRPAPARPVRPARGPLLPAQSPARTATALSRDFYMMLCSSCRNDALSATDMSRKRSNVYSNRPTPPPPAPRTRAVFFDAAAATSTAVTCPSGKSRPRRRRRRREPCRPRRTLHCPSCRRLLPPPQCLGLCRGESPLATSFKFAYIPKNNFENLMHPGFDT